MEKMLIISPLPPYNVLLRAMFVRWIQMAGVEVEFWNISAFTWGAEHSKRHGVPAMEQRVFDTFPEFETALGEVDRDTTLCNMQVWNHPDIFPVYEAIARAKLTTSMFYCRPFPYQQKEITFVRKILRQVRSFLKKTIPFLSRNKHKYPVPDIVFCSGPLVYEAYVKSSLIVRTNYMDYEDWLLQRNKNKQKRDCCVYLDEAMVHHPDSQLCYNMGFHSSEEIDSFFKSMTLFFDRIESELGLPVIIAAHPKAKYEGGEFGKREIVYNDVFNLMSRAKLAIGHASTSLAIGAMNKIPMALITNETLVPFYSHMRFLSYNSKAFKIPLWDTDNLPDPLQLPEFDPNAYDDFLLKYHTWPEYLNTPSGPDVGRFVRELSPFH